jgi:hypothetical protein
MDTLKSKTISLDELPVEAKPPIKKLGRTGELWAKLLALKPGQAEAVENRSWQHGTLTLRHMRMKSSASGLNLNSKRNGLMLYLWLDRKGEDPYAGGQDVLRTLVRAY